MARFYRCDRCHKELAESGPPGVLEPVMVMLHVGTPEYGDTGGTPTVKDRSRRMELCEQDTAALVRAVDDWLRFPNL